MRHLALCLALAAASPLASAACLPILGTVQLSKDDACTVIGLFPQEMQGSFVGQCYKSVLKLGGLIPAYGYSGVTLEEIDGQFGTKAYSPASVQGGRNLLTARSTFSMGGTRFYAAEVIIESDGLVTEQSVITRTDGKGLMKKATGGFTIMGDSTTETAQVRGQICTP